ncbi:hypothetical protein HMN09_01097000 [Mycena chlorophos]|uniref:Zn(2)-C6 fungal-type domain-containing protein n=1 Tax=Mycena chlorophos TaxID=658473 RepID=A0A8H6SDG3_MYCCL|nr:hypothetical protein HMN09_01097000 [Mycena chlorophos]
MSSSDEDDLGLSLGIQAGGRRRKAANAKKPVMRREQRACDVCRKRRRACNGSRVPPRSCTLCAELGVECLFTGVVAKRRTYVEALEDKVREAEMKVEKKAVEIAPQTDSSGAASAADSPSSSSDSGPAATSGPGPGVELAALSIRSMNTPAPVACWEDAEYLELIQGLAVLSLSNHRDHFHGQGSSAMVVKTVVEMRERYERRDLVWAGRREKYWTFTPTTEKMRHLGPYIFPPPDLLNALVDLYFTHKNPFLPLLHRPTFEASVADGLHKRDHIFGGIVLLVCGIGARFSSDRRVTPLGMDELMCGYGFFHQVKLGLEHMFSRPTLHQMQLYCLYVIFCEYANPSSCWTVVGAALRMAQDVGAHRKPTKPTPPTVESELWKRAFWVCVFLDRQLSTGVGRPSMIPWEDFDAHYPLEVDDEYWDTWVQPEEKGPSTIAFFNALLKASVIVGFALTHLYGLDKARVRLSFRDDQWEERIVAELDSSLNAWVAALPPHLRWDSTKQSRPASSPRAELFLDQAAVLWAIYYYTQITVHRPFIPQLRTGKDRGKEIEGFPALAICTNAARSCVHVVRKIHARHPGMGEGKTMFPGALMAAFLVAIILSLNVWSGKRTGLPPHMNTAVDEVRACLAYMKSCEKRWQGAGLFSDVITELCTLSDIPVNTPPSASSDAPSNDKKRAREPEAAPFSTGLPTEAARIFEGIRSKKGRGELYAYIQNPTDKADDDGWKPSGAHHHFHGDETAAHGEDGNHHSPEPRHDLPTSAAELAQMPIYEVEPGMDAAAMDVDLGMLAAVPTGFEIEDWAQWMSNQLSGSDASGKSNTGADARIPS